MEPNLSGNIHKFKAVLKKLVFDAPVTVDEMVSNISDLKHFQVYEDSRSFDAGGFREGT